MPDTIQFLFRTYHTPIKATDNWPNGFFQSQYPMYPKSQDFAYSDYLCSMPETTTGLARVASQLVFGDACLYVRTSIFCVVVWQLSGDGGVDNQTPVAIFHPFLSRNLAPLGINSTILPGDASLALDGGGRVGNELGNPYRLGHPFRCYELSGQGARLVGVPMTVDDFHAGVIARKTERGKSQLSFAKRSICYEDVFIGPKNTLILNTDGTFAGIRFRLWEQTIASLPFRHSGWQLLENGQLKRVTIAQSKRTAHGVTDMAQQRRQFIRQDHAKTVLVDAWYQALQEFLAWFWINQGYNFGVAIYAQMQRVANRRVYMTVPPLKFLKVNISIALDWLNLVGVAMGNDFLIAPELGDRPIDRQGKYEIAVERLTTEDGTFHRAMFRAGTKQPEIMQHMIDLCASLQLQIYQYEQEIAAYANIPIPNTGTGELQYWYGYAALYDKWCKRWPQMQADFYSVFCLFCSWQLVSRFVIPTRAESAADAIRNRIEVWPQRNTMQAPVVRVPRTQTGPRLDGRFVNDRPVLAPFRINEVQSVSPDLDQQNYELGLQKQQEDFEALKAYWDAKDAAAKAARRAAMDAHIAKMRAQWMKEDVPNPDDLWDYRNYTRANYWLVELKEPLNTEFVLRTLDVPDELEELQNIYEDIKAHAATAKKATAKENPHKELTPPSEQAFVVPIVKRLGRWAYDAAVETGKERFQEYANDQVEQKLKEFRGPPSPYSDRQFWPPDTDRP